MHKVTFFLFLLLSISTQAQFKISTLQDVAPFEKGALEFPFIKATNTKVADKINAILQARVLDNETVITDPHQVFRNSKYIHADSTNTYQAGFSDVSFADKMNTARVLSLEFDLETVGAYGSNFKGYYSFDAQTGKLVLTKEIFTAEGLNYLRKYLVKERKKDIARYIAEELPEDADTAYIKERYTECNKKADEDNIFILSKNIMFYKEGCFPHADRPYETDLNITIPIEQLKKYLTAYGKKLLL